MRMRSLLLLFGGLLAVLAAPLHAGTASLLLDINPGEAFQPEMRIQSPFLPLGTSALVAIHEPGSGREVWVTDGTEQGTRPLLDLCPAGCSSYFTPLAAVGPVGIFTAYHPDDEPRLWRSDGTRLGTFPLSPGPGGGSLRSCGSSTATIGSQLLFAARFQDEAECGLWRTDGTVAGTVMLRESSTGAITAAGGRAFFVTYVRPAWQLWSSDGTQGGTILLHEWTGSAGTLVAAGSRLFFLVQEDGRELWTSDGTPAGTRRLTQFAAAEPFVGRLDSLSGFVLQDAGGSACFLANPTGTERELWCSDGTAAGTRKVTSLALASPFLGLESWSVEKMGGGRFLFPASDGSGNRWWTSDGQPGSTAPLTGCPGGCPALETGAPRVRLGALVFFTALGTGPSDPEEPPTTDLWVTDGTGAGTRRVGDFCETCRVEGLTPLLGRVVFATGRDTEDLWISDGTPQGTQVLVRLGNDFSRPGLPYPPAVLRGRGLFTLGERNRLEGGKGLWVSDATPEGTGMLDVLGSNGLGSQPSQLVPTPDGVRFLAYGGGDGFWSSQGTTATTLPIPIDLRPESLTAFGALTLIQEYRASLWRTDGTAAGTFPLTPEGLVVERPVVLGNRAVFLAREEGDPTFSLWRTDGTVAGTQEIAVLPENVAWLVPAGASALIGMYRSPDEIFWRTDGTAAGTREIPLPADFRYNRGDVAQLGSALYFGGSSREGGHLWRSDGTPGGTRPLAPNLLGSPGSFTVHAGALYVLAHTAGTGSVQNGLFRSDGTDAGTVLLATVPRSTTGEPDLAFFTSVGNLLFFVLDDEQRGRELWRTDGTPAGTFLVRDIVPGPLSSQPRYRSLTALNGRLYFTAPSSATGTELWESDGTETGTRPVQDIWPGAFSSEQGLTARC
jgi:ELWxxDGT repeat protein